MASPVPRGSPTGRGATLDGAVALLVAASVLTVYVRTLLPHLGGTEDTPKFQYLGYVLGTAHHPGYPLYVMVAHLFSYLPIGTLAYRINLMSACFGALAAALIYLILRHFKAHQVTCAAVALAFACGRFFWSNAVIAEVYTLGAALVAAAALKLLHWKGSRRNGDLYWAVAFAALALGNHLTILAVIPALVLYVVLTDLRAIRPRVIGVTMVLVALGLAQYGFVWIRTLQGGPYLEARASSLPELIQVLTARRWASLMFGFSLSDLIFERVPELARLGLAEIGRAGSALLVVGVPLILRRRPREGMLLMLGAGGVFALTLNVAADAAGFLVPAFALTWPVIGIGLEGIRSGIAQHVGRRAGIALLSATALLPAAQIARNFRINDQHGHTFETRYFQALFEQLPRRVGFIAENYTVDQMLTYMLASGEATGESSPPLRIPRELRRIEQLLDEGVSIFAFPAARQALMGRGIEFTPVHLLGSTPPAYLESVNDDEIVVITGLGPMLPPDAAAAIGLESPNASALARPFVIAGVKGATRGALELAGAEAARGLNLQTRQEIGRTGVRAPVALRAATTATGGAIWVGGREVARTELGLALATVGPGGDVTGTRVFDLDHDMRATLDMGPRPLFRVASVSPCIELGDGGWREITAVVGRSRMEWRVDNYRAFDSFVLMYLGADSPLQLQLADYFTGCQDSPCPEQTRPELTVDSYLTTDPVQLAALERSLEEDGLTRDEALGQARLAYRVRLIVNDGGHFTVFAVELGGPPTRALARAETDLKNPRRAVACVAPTDAEDPLSRSEVRNR